MNQLLTEGIVLSRTDFGEADRILTLLTPERGKLRLVAKGARRVKSKLAGGIELFSISDITYITGRGELGTLISARMKQHYGKIIVDISRVQLAYDLIKTINTATEDHPEPDYFYLLKAGLAAVDDLTIDADLIRLWFQSQLLKLGGHPPNLQSDMQGSQLQSGNKYTFDYDQMCFANHPAGTFTADEIKGLRLLFSNHDISSLHKVNGLAEQLPGIAPLIRAMLTSYIRV